MGLGFRVSDAVQELDKVALIVYAVDWGPWATNKDSVVLI